MSKKNNKSEEEEIIDTGIPELDKLLEKEKRSTNRNNIKNRPILYTSYFVVFIFLALIGYNIYFMVHDSKTVIANSRNSRQDSMADTVVRGKILTADGYVIAETKVDDDGNETRNYPYDDLFCHAAGYNSYGRSGLELSCNFYLLSSNVNIFKRVYKEITETKKPGDNVITTLDYDLQKTAYDALGNNRGAVIVMEPDTGKILAMVSKPGFNPNKMDQVWEDVHSEEGSSSTVLLNRTTQGLYAPGSTFKILTMLEYIRENPDYKSYTYDCDAVSIFNGVDIHCSNEKAHGEVDTTLSIAKSCNTSMANIGTSLNMDSFRSMLDNMMFNGELPYDGNYSKSHFVLNGDSDKSYIPQTVIGQGDTEITPLHNCLIFAAIANGGVVMKPYMVASVENSDGANITTFRSKSYKSIMEPEEAEALTEMLVAVCKEGTAKKYFSDTSYTVAGKTGTAEYDSEGNCNSWFVAFSNVEDPDIVVSVLVEDYTSNQLSGMYVAKQIFDEYYK